MTDLADIEILTFDCYGTLIDWGSGLSETIAELAQRHAVETPLEHLLTEWEAIQFEMIGGTYRKYRDILTDSLTQTFAKHDVELSTEECQLLGVRLPEWPAFADTVDSLARLKRNYQLAILSNIDDDLLTGSLPKLNVTFDELITAEQVNSYKPQLVHFSEALRRFDRPAKSFLHCAFGFKYDHRPALNIGMQTVWIKRPGWIRDDDAIPTFETPDLAGLADLLGC
ncbi:MAG: haloacid dehalogenase type II [Pirellulales bacterium]|nr:haloacid dehalogenase type II [Pirellulales bacterium]